MFQVQGVNQSIKDAEGLRKTGQVILHQTSFQDDSHFGWVQLWAFFINTQESQWSLNVRVLDSFILKEKQINKEKTIKTVK